MPMNLNFAFRLVLFGAVRLVLFSVLDLSSLSQSRSQLSSSALVLRPFVLIAKHGPTVSRPLSHFTFCFCRRACVFVERERSVAHPKRCKVICGLPLFFLLIWCFWAIREWLKRAPLKSVPHEQLSIFCGRSTVK